MTADQATGDPRARQWMLVLPWSDPRVQAVLSALAAFGSEVLWAWIRHDKDPGTSVHVHIVLRFKNPKARSFIARHLGVATSSVRKLTGQKGWERYLRYLTHSDPEPGIPSGEHLYGDDEVFANFDWKNAVVEAELPKTRAPKAGAVAEAILTGEITLEDVQERYPGLYAKKGNASWFRSMERDRLALREKKREQAEFVRDAEVEVILTHMGIDKNQQQEYNFMKRADIRERRKSVIPDLTRQVTERMRREGWPLDPTV
ncbi:Rep family protein [Corynebacterium glyciniphilum]|nr:Rep family protein [Corynebacterium glyciniphilum]